MTPATDDVPADETSRRVETALQDRLGGAEVDVARLLTRVVDRSRRARARRRVGVATGCAVAIGATAFVVPGLVASGGTGRVGTTAGAVGAPADAPRPSTSARAASPSSAAGDPEHKLVPGDDADAARRRAYAEEVAYPIPAGVALRQADFPGPLTSARFDSGQYRLQPTVSGQSCQDPSITGPGPGPVAGRQWSWSREHSDFTFDLVVTGWKAGTGPARFRDVLEDTGACRWLRAQHDVTTGDLGGGDEAWAGADTFAGLTFGHALVRVGDVLVGVEVTAPVAEGGTTELARRLAGTTAARVRAAGVGAATTPPAAGG